MFGWICDIYRMTAAILKFFIACLGESVISIGWLLLFWNFLFNSQSCSGTVVLQLPPILWNFFLSKSSPLVTACHEGVPKKCSKIPKSGKFLEKYFQFFFLAYLESRHHNMRKYAKIKLKFFPSLAYTEDIVMSTFYSKTEVFWTFLKNAQLELAHIRSRYGPHLSR